MDCREDLAFHDDSSRAVEKAKESILLMKKKMFRSHDLILQYNNKLKECDRLKEDLCIAQEEGSKLKRENSMNLLKVGKLESQIEEWKKSQVGLEQKIADQEIRIAGDKCHVQQLICKLEGIESQHLEKVMEMDLQKSSMEVKIKELEQELKRLNKSHQVQIQKLEKMNCPKVKKAARKTQVMEKEMIDVGTNTVMVEPMKLAKPDKADKSILTDEFYHMKDNPYPIFCDTCESLISPSVEKICKIMTAHPPLLGEMLSPPRPRVPEKTRNLNGPLEPIVSQCSQEPPENIVNAIVPEIDTLKRKLVTLERKLKKRKKENFRESLLPNSNCCGHARATNYCNHASGTGHNVPMPNAQPDIMAEFWNRIMQFTNGTLPKQNTPQVQRKSSTKTKLLKLKKQKKFVPMRNKSKHSGKNWEIESVDCQSEIDATMENNVESNSDRLHILRLKPSKDTEILPPKIRRKKSTGKTRASSTIHVDEFTEKDEEIGNESSNESPIEIRKKSKRPNASLFNDDAEIEKFCAQSAEAVAKTNNSQVSQRRSSSRIQERKKLRSRETEAKKSVYTSEYLSASSDVDLDDRETIKSSRKSASKCRKISSDTESADDSQNSAINESTAIFDNSNHAESSVGIVRSSTNDKSLSDSKKLDSTGANISNVTQNSTNNYSDLEISTSHNLSQQDEALSDAQLEYYSDSEPPEYTRSFLVPEKNTRKRKRANSPKVKKRTSRSKLLGKIRALKKNSIGIATKVNPSVINEIPPYQQKISHESVTENAVMATGNETALVAPNAKKQRIAHVPKPASSNESDIAQENYVTEDNKKYHKNRSKFTELEGKPSNARLNVSAETLTETKCPEDSEAELPKSPAVRRTSLPITTENSEESDRSKLLSMESAPSSKIFTRLKPTNIDELQAERSDDSDGSKLSSVELTSTVKSTIIGDLQSEHLNDSDCAKLLPIDSPANLEIMASAKSTIMSDLRAECSDDSDTPKLSSIDLAPNLSTISRTKSPIIVGPRSEYLEDPNELKLSSTGSISGSTNFAIAKSAIIDDPRSETPQQLDPQSTSPASLPASLHQLSMTSRILPVLPMPSRVPRPIKILDTTNSDKIELSKMIPFDINSFIAKTSLLTTPEMPKPLEASIFSSSNPILSGETKEIPTCTNFSLNTTNKIIAVTSIRTNVGQNESQENTTNSSFGDEASRVASHEQTLTLLDESPASPDASVFSNDSSPADWQSTKNLTLPKKVQRHLSIYDQAELRISEKIPTPSASSNIIATRVAKTERIPLTYDPSLFGNQDGEFEDTENFDSPTISNSQNFFSETHGEINKNERNNDRSGNLQNVVKDLRTRKVQCGGKSVASQQNQEKNDGLSHEDGKSVGPIDAATYQRGIRSLGTLLGRHLTEMKKKNCTKGLKLRRAAAVKLQKEAEKVVKNELDKLVNSEIWTSALQTEVITNILQASSPRTVAKSIVDFLIERANLDEPLDRTYTPPAPVMTKTQQRIVTLISGIERDGTMSGLFEFIMTGLNFNLTKLGWQHQVEILEYLARMFTILGRLKKDRESVRIMCCDAFYFHGRKLYNVMYAVLTVWPEVFPMHSSQMDPVINSMVHLLRVDEYIKAVALRRMLKDYYKYPEREIQTIGFMMGLMNELEKKYTGELEAAIVLVAKREGCPWTYKNVVNGGLLKIVNEPTYPSLFNALRLVGFLMRVFPLEDEDGAVELIIEKLGEIFNSPEASPDQQEGVVAALLCISRHFNKFDDIANSILTWKPPQPMRITTIEQLNVFFKLRAPEWWNNRKRLQLQKLDV